MRAPVFARAGTFLYVNLARINSVAVGPAHPEVTEPRAVVTFAGESGQVREVFRGADALALRTLLDLLSVKPGQALDEDMLELALPVELHRLLAEDADRLGVTVEENVARLLAEHLGRPELVKGATA